MKNNAFMIFCFVILCAASQAHGQTINIVAPQFAPYEFEKNGEARGIAVEIVKEAFKKIEQPIDIRFYPWARAIMMIEEGDADAIFTIYKNSQRETFADFSNEVVIAQVISLFVLGSSTITFDGDLSKLAEFSFGMLRKSSYGSKFDSAVSNGLIAKPQESSSQEVIVEKLLLGRFSILVNNRYVTLNVLKAMNRMDEVKELSPEIQNIPSYIAFSKKSKLSLVRDKFDAALAQMKKDGTYDAIIKNYFN